VLRFVCVCVCVREREREREREEEDSQETKKDHETRLHSVLHFVCNWIDLPRGNKSVLLESRRQKERNEEWNSAQVKSLELNNR
jgi:hypothetical protein